MPKLLQSAARFSAGLPAGAMLQSQGPLHGLGCDCLDISPNLQLAATGGADKLVKLHPLLVGTDCSIVEMSCLAQRSLPPAASGPSPAKLAAYLSTATTSCSALQPFLSRVVCASLLVCKDSLRQCELCCGDRRPLWTARALLATQTAWQP